MGSFGRLSLRRAKFLLHFRGNSVYNESRINGIINNKEVLNESSCFRRSW